ncbi:MAG: LPS assembly lipoprotein LptE [Proteobacteria bacterium]|jgi:LPS-assembly lipoprotein|nr:LPS assembly lipoprotein LptE [Pseudomonadota bacterium]
MTLRRAWLLACIVLLLAGCGFHLRGSGGTAIDLEALHLAAGAYSEIGERLTEGLTASGVILAPNASDAPYSLYLSDERNSRRGIATTAAISVAEYEIRTEVDIELRAADGRVLIPRTTLVSEQTYDFDVDRLESSAEEESLLRREMRRELAQQIMRRLASVTGRDGPGDQKPDSIGPGAAR